MRIPIASGARLIYNALSLDGITDGVEIADDNSLDALRTLEVWVKQYEMNVATGFFKVLISKNTEHKWGLYYDSREAYNRFQSNFSDSNGNVSGAIWRPSDYGTSGTWHHVVAQINADLKSELFVNGVSVGVGNDTLDDPLGVGTDMTGEPVRIGGKGGATTRYTLCDIATARGYSTVVSSADIALLGANPAWGTAQIYRNTSITANDMKFFMDFNRKDFVDQSTAGNNGSHIATANWITEQR